MPDLVPLVLYRDKKGSFPSVPTTPTVHFSQQQRSRNVSIDSSKELTAKFYILTSDFQGWWEKNGEHKASLELTGCILSPYLMYFMWYFYIYKYIHIFVKSFSLLRLHEAGQRLKNGNGTEFLVTFIPIAQYLCISTMLQPLRRKKRPHAGYTRCISALS